MTISGCSENTDSALSGNSGVESHALASAIVGAELRNDIVIFKMLDGGHKGSEPARYLMARSIMVSIILINENNLGPESGNWGIDSLAGLCYINEYIDELALYVHKTEADYVKRYIDTVIDYVHERLKPRRAKTHGIDSICGFAIEDVINDIKKKSGKE
ncbi:MAG: hypothetical protein V2I38_04005 [Alcanivoracaceae bacterium]|jgi:hypothetical protein|nr:hypothetical protein [Alcanivoracaceae bacterium]